MPETTPLYLRRTVPTSEVDFQGLDVKKESDFVQILREEKDT
jgi:hypothetical protein